VTGEICGAIDGIDLLARSQTASRPLCDHSSEEDFQ